MNNQRIRLTEAAKIIGVHPKSLRSERDKGRLVIWRVAGKDWTSLAEIDRMFELCHAPPKAPVYGCAQNAKHQEKNNPQPGLLETEIIQKAQAAALETVRRLKQGLPTTSKINTRQNAETADILQLSR